MRRYEARVSMRVRPGFFLRRVYEAGADFERAIMDGMDPMDGMDFE